MNKNQTSKLLPFAAAVLFLILAAGLVLAIRYELFQETIEFIHQDISHALFIILMVILPVLGFPISIFLVLGGIKFGIISGLLLWLVILPVHALIGFVLASWIRKPLQQISIRMGYPIPPLPEKGTAMFSFLFLAIPGIPYAGKNYILPLAGAPFSYCVIMNIIVQFPQGIPFVIMGESVIKMDPFLLYVAIALLVLLYIILWWLKKKSRQQAR